jgi:heme exporter protein A
MISVTALNFERFLEPVFLPVSFTLGAGELMLLTGSNGCGKTTLIRLLAGVLEPDSGTIEINTGSIAYVGHHLAIKDDLSVRENLRFTRDFSGSSDLDVEEVILKMGLRWQADQLARTLSAGQRKRCALGRLLLTPSELWMLDEPYSNLDQQGVDLLDGLLHAHLENGGACLMATHGVLRPQGIEARETVITAGGPR